MIAQPQTIHARTIPKTAAEKERNLRLLMRRMRSVLVAYSGGVDSTYLALVATQELGKNAACVMGISPSVSAFQRAEGETAARDFGLNFTALETAEMSDPNYVANPQNRCYFCKSELYAKLTEYAAGHDIENIIDGTNADDIGGHRPGRIAADEKNVRSPLVETGFTKAEIRERSKHFGLPTWDKPASPCLASRIAYGVPVTIERLGKVERGEAFLRDQGFREFRVRVHDDLARIEISQAEMEKILDLESAGRIAAAFRDLGFQYVTLDLQGFRSGAMNEALNGD